MRVHNSWFETLDFYNRNHSSANGRFTSGGSGGKGGDSGTSDTPPARLYAGKLTKVGTSSLAIKRLKEGETVSIKNLKTAATVVNALAKAGMVAASMGNKAKNINMCKVSVPGTNLFCGDALKIPRSDMPQFSGTPRPGSPADKLPKNANGNVDATQAYMDHMVKSGVKITERKVIASTLKASQAELVGSKVAGMVNNKKFDPAGEAIFVSKDGYVIDGHHRWAAQVTRDLRDGKLGQLSLNVRVVDMGIRDVLKASSKFAREFGIEAKAG